MSKHTLSPVSSERTPNDQRLSVSSLPYAATRHNAMPAFQKPKPLTSFSYDASHRLHFDNSALRYFRQPPSRNADLNHGYARWIRKPDEKGRIDNLLHSLVHAKLGFAEDAGVVGWRGVLTRILTAPEENRDGWSLNVMIVNGTMFLEEHLSEDKLRSKNDIEPWHRKQMYYGYAFESYCTMDSTSSSANSPGWGGDVDTNIQWCSVVRTKLGEEKIIIGGEVDCLRGDYNPNSTANYVELKTSMNMRGQQDETKFHRKLLKFYFQSFLLGVPEIIVGFRTPQGMLTSTKSHQTLDIPKMVRQLWDYGKCVTWGSGFFEFVRRTCQSATSSDVWRVEFVPSEGVQMRRLDAAEVAAEVQGSEDRVGFLPRWFWDELAEKEPKSQTEGQKVPTSGKTMAFRYAPSTVAGWVV